jgi:hypothetical protein
MPITVPPFVQYQVQLPPLRGLWNRAPAEGDRFVSAEIDWGITTGIGMAVQFALSGNSPVAFSQIVALSVDNSKCGSDTRFLFPDSAFTLNVPAFNQGVYNVYTNALMFYVTSPFAAIGDRTVFQVLNSMPPPIAIQPTQEQATASVTAVNLAVNATTQITPITVNGTLEGLSISVVVNSPALQCGLFIQDGTGRNIWAALISQTQYFQIMPINIRFTGGLQVVVQGTTITSGQVNISAYYSIP